jgi:hypothetical protein
VLLTAVMLAAAVTVATAPASARSTHVVCVNDDWDTWRVDYRPHRRTLHQKRHCWCHAASRSSATCSGSAGGGRTRVVGAVTYDGGVTVTQHVFLNRPRWGRTHSTGPLRFLSQARIVNRFGARRPQRSVQTMNTS